MDSVSRINLNADVGQVGAQPVALEGQPVGQLEDLPVQVLAANDPVVADNAPVVADAQDPVAPPPGPPIANHVVKPHVPPDQTLANEAKGKLVPDKEGLIGLIGKGPKEDTKLFGSFGPTIHRSTHYKAVLGALDSYHTLLQNSSGLEPGSLDAAIEGHLANLEKKCEEYLDAKFAPNKDAMRAFLETVKEQRALIGAATDLLGGLVGVDHNLSLPEVIGLIETHPGITAADVKGLVEKDLIDLVRANPKLTLQDLAFVEQMGLDFSSVQEQATHVGDLAAKIADAHENMSGKPDEARASNAQGTVSDVQKHTSKLAQALKQNVDGARALGLSPADARAYFDAGVPITEKTVGGGAVVGALTPFGGGAVNSVSKGPYQWADGTNNEAVFKPALQIDYGNAACLQQTEEMGVELGYTGFPMRNVASSLVDQRLGTNIIVKTELAVHGGQLYVVMEKANGTTPMKTGDVYVKIDASREKQFTSFPKAPAIFAKLNGFTDLVKDESGRWKAVGPKGAPYMAIAQDTGNPQLRLQVTKLQWVDAAVYERDRHGGNFVVGQNAEGELVVKGIDNDLSFGAETDPTKRDFQNLGLPPVIDRATAVAFRALRDDPETLVADLQRLVPPAEVEAFKARLEIICREIDKLESEGKVLDDLAAWGPSPEGSDPIGDLLGVNGTDSSVSYMSKISIGQAKDRRIGNAIDANLVA